MSTQYQCRKPTSDELNELKMYLIERGNPEEAAEDLVKNYWFAVFDDYISDGPGYAGKILFAVWGLPEFYEVYIWEDGKIRALPQDEQFHRSR